MQRTLKAAIVLGAAPLLTGIAIFLAWLVIRVYWAHGAFALMFAGVLLPHLGVLCLAAGAVCLGIWIWRARRAGAPRQFIVRHTAAVLALFASNFIAAGGAFVGAIYITTRYTVSVTNASHATLHDVRVHGGGVDEDLGNIAPGETARCAFWIDHDGQLVLTARQGPERVEADVDSYVTHNIGGDATVTVSDGGAVEVHHRRQPGD